MFIAKLAPPLTCSCHTGLKQSVEILKVVSFNLMHLLSFSYPLLPLDGTTRNTTSFPSHGDAPYGAATSQYDSNASWHNSSWYNATNGGTTNGTGECCWKLGVIGLYVLAACWSMFVLLLSSCCLIPFSVRIDRDIPKWIHEKLFPGV